MKLMSNELFKAVRYALYAGATAAVGLSAGTVFAQDDNTSQKLETITVTGSNIRRVDIETSNPIVTVDRAAIERSGKLTVGDLLQSLPAVTGGNVNAQVNNGGSYSGTASIGLRGLGSQRTLVLINGQRYLSGDPNAIPSSLIERIEVLTDGASAVYGSDAIAGVVNFILRADYQGAEFRADYGISDHDDGVRKGFHFTFGQTSDKGSIMAGVEYNHQDQILAGNRQFSKNAVDLTAGPTTAPYTFIGGSSSPSPGRIVLPESSGLRQIFGGCSQIAVNAGATGRTVDTTNYHCFTNADKFNYAAVNLILAPQERTSAFLNGTYHLTDSVDAYLTVMHSKTSASIQLAPSIIGTNGGLVISADSYYNPFGFQFGNGGSTFQLRNVATGPRRNNATTNTEQVNTGIKGRFDIGNQNWTWDAGFGYGHISVLAQKFGLPNLDILNRDLGPSFVNGSGQVVCGTPTAPIVDGCTPFNIFNINNANADPAAVAALRAAAAPAQVSILGTEKYEHLEVSGGLFELPAGTVQLAGGVSHRTDYTRSTVDSLLNINPATNNCTLGTQCSAGLQGGFSVKEAYAEMFVPVLKDLPFIHALNMTLGDRYSKYSSFGSTSNWKVALEWRPIEDLLLRGTVSKVFRAPTIANVFGPPASIAPTLNHDPCDYDGSGTNPNAGNPACRGVPTTGPFHNIDVANRNQINATASGSNYAGFPLGPELGKSFDFGVVYDPTWLEGLSVGADVWRVYLLNTITGINSQAVIDLCFNGALKYCSLISRNQGGDEPGQINNVTEPTGNLGRTDVSGVDIRVNYRLPEFSFGKFSLAANATYLKNFNVDPAPGLDGDKVFHLAGHFIGFDSGALSACPGNTGACTLPRWKATTALNWSLGNFDASWRMRYFGRYRIGNPNLDEQQSAYPGLAGSFIDHGAIAYNDLSFGYNIEPINTRVDLGVDNVGDRQPPFFGFDSQTLNAGTDPSTFDTIGRYYHASVTVKF